MKGSERGDRDSFLAISSERVPEGRIIPGISAIRKQGNPTLNGGRNACKYFELSELQSETGEREGGWEPHESAVARGRLLWL